MPKLYYGRDVPLRPSLFMLADYIAAVRRRWRGYPRSTDPGLLFAAALLEAVARAGRARAVP